MVYSCIVWWNDISGNLWANRARAWVKFRRKAYVHTHFRGFLACLHAHICCIFRIRGGTNFIRLPFVLHMLIEGSKKSFNNQSCSLKIDMYAHMWSFSGRSLVFSSSQRDLVVCHYGLPTNQRAWIDDRNVSSSYQLDAGKSTSNWLFAARHNYRVSKAGCLSNFIVPDYLTETTPAPAL